MTSIEKELTSRLIRIESKLVRGFEEFGINIDKEKDWLSVDDQKREVHVTTLGRSLIVMLADMKRCGANNIGEMYSVFYKDTLVAHIMFAPKLIHDYGVAE